MSKTPPQTHDRDVKNIATHNQTIKDWLEVADRNITNFTKSPFHDQLLTRRRAFYTEVFRKKERALKALSGLFHKAHKAEPFDLTMSRIQAPFGCWELGTQIEPYSIKFVLPTGESEDELAYRFVFMAVNARLMNQEDFIRHTCDNRKCLRPDHIIIGTAQDNWYDNQQRIYAGRGSEGKGQIITGEIARGVEVSIHPQALVKDA